MHFPILEVTVLGLANGAIYALTALGLSLVYKATRVVNFAQGEIGTLAAFVAWEVVVKAHQSWAEGALAAVAVAAAVGWLMHRFVATPMRNASRVSVMIATLGVAFLLFGVEAKLFGPSPEILPPPLARSSFTGVTVGGYLLTPVYLFALAAAAVAAAVFATVLRRTRFGLGVLASAQDPETARLLGVPAARVSAFTWIAAAVLGAVAGLLTAPTQGVFYPFFMSGTLFFRGLVAALIGGLGSLSGAVVGGLVVGVVEAYSIEQFIHSPGLPEVVLLVLVLAVLLLRPQGLVARRALA
ncbi:MAG TPA: branched-chain amino acid ABC transporter permease [Acidimicrobiales bacterium]|nr:branched-chain amino acid ABC transporter permease [Acidimicrobiales bacterium]